MGDVELTRFRGHLKIWGNHDAKNAQTLSRRIQEEVGGSGRRGTESRRAVATVRAIGAGDPELGGTGRARYWGAKRRGDHERKRRVATPEACERAAAGRAGDLKKSRGLVRAGDREGIERIFFFVDAHQAKFSIRAMCRVLEVSPSGYYAWRRRKISVRSRQDEALRGRIIAIHEQSRRTYGSPRIHAELKDEGTDIGRKRVARLMREAGVAGVSRRKWIQTTRRDPATRPAPDLVDRKFEASGPNQLWVADMTYIPTAVGFHFLAVGMYVM